MARMVYLAGGERSVKARVRSWMIFLTDSWRSSQLVRRTGAMAIRIAANWSRSESYCE